MPVYFFDFLAEDDEQSDDIGTDLANLQAARDEASETLVSIAREQLPRGGSSGQLGIRVRNDSGRVLLTISIIYSEEPTDWARSL